MEDCLYIRIDSDHWDDHGKIYRVLQYKRRDNSTAVELQLEIDNHILNRVVPVHSIEWVQKE